MRLISVVSSETTSIRQSKPKMTTGKRFWLMAEILRTDEVAEYFGKKVLREVDENQFLDNIPDIKKKISDRAVLRAIHFFGDNYRAKAETEALKNNRFVDFLTLVNESGDSSMNYLQNLYSCRKPTEQGIPLAIMAGKRILKGNGAVRVHGGGFAGTVQAFVPNDLVNAYRSEMDRIFGQNSCYIMTIRAQVLRDGVVVDYTGALRIVRSLKERLEARLGTELVNCAIAMPAGTESSVKTHQYVAEGAGLEVTNILDEPSAANAIYQIEDGVVVDIGGGTTGLAILKEGKVVQIEDEPTGGTHLTLVLSGNYHVSFEEAEAIKQDYKRHREILPVVRPVVEKMATIVSRYVDKAHTDTIYLCGGTCCLTGIEDIFQKVTGIRTIKPANPFLVTPTGIAMNCTLE